MAGSVAVEGHGAREVAEISHLIHKFQAERQWIWHGSLKPPIQPPLTHLLQQGPPSNPFQTVLLTDY